MNELSRILILFVLIISNYIFLTIGLWAWLPDLFIVQTLLFTAFSKKIPSVYFFIIKGFIIDLFFSEYSVPYTISFSLIGLFLNFGKLKWIQRSFLEQIIMEMNTTFEVIQKLNDIKKGIDGKDALEKTKKINTEVLFKIKPFFLVFMFL